MEEIGRTKVTFYKAADSLDEWERKKKRSERAQSAK